MTSARHELLSRHYAENYPETFDPLTEKEYVYCGPHRMNDPLPSSDLTVGEALLSPTRTYLPLIKKISEEIGKELKGAVHCSGGGQTKCLRFGTEVKYVKDNLFSLPPIFSEIQKVSKTSPREMHQVYNMGHRLEAYCNPECTSQVISIANSFGIDAQIIGHTESSNRPDQANHVTIRRGETELTYG